MKEVVRITSKYQNTIFEAVEEMNGVFMVLTENFWLISKRDLETKPEFRDERPLVWQVSPHNFKFEFEYDTAMKPPVDKKDDEGSYYRQKAAYELNERKMRSVKEFWSRHSRINHLTPFDNEFTPSNDGFFIEIVTQKAKRAVINDVKKIKICNMVLAMSLTELIDLALYYAPHLYGKRKSEMLYGLIGLKGIGTDEASLGGALWQGTNADDFLLKYFDNPTVSMKVYISKAERMGILTKGANGGLYLNGSAYCGQNIDEAVVHFTTDVQAYTNIIQPEVNRISQLPVDDMVEVDLDVKGSPMGKAYRSENRANNEKSSAAYPADYQRLNEEYHAACSKLGQKPIDPIRYNELKAEIDRVRLELANVRLHESTQTGQLMERLDDLITNDVDELKAIAAAEGIKGLQMYKDVEKIKDRIRQHRSEATTV